LKQSDPLNRLFNNIQGEKSLAMIHDCPTRWSSTFFMLERAILLKQSIADLALEVQKNKN